MSVLKRLSSNPTLRGLLTFYREYLGISKRKFGYVGYTTKKELQSLDNYKEILSHYYNGTNLKKI